MAIICLFGGALVRFTTGTDTPEMVENAVLSLRIHFATFPFLGVLFALRHALQSMGYKVIPVCSSCIELGMKFLSAHWLIPLIGFVGTCVTEPVTWGDYVKLPAGFLSGQSQSYRRKKAVKS